MVRHTGVEMYRLPSALSGPRPQHFSLKKFLTFWEMELFSPKNKKFQEGTLRARNIKETYSEKISYISGN